MEAKRIIFEDDFVFRIEKQINFGTSAQKQKQ